MSTKILGLNLKIKDKIIKLDMDEAEELFEALEKLFGTKIIRYYHRKWYWDYPASIWTTTDNTNTMKCSYTANNGSLNIEI